MTRFFQWIKSTLPQRIRRWYAPKKALANEYQFTRFIILRLLGLCYTMAFLVFVRQAPGLIGENGILPIERFFELVSRNHGGAAEVFRQMPSIFWFEYSDRFLLALGWVGLAVSITVLCGYANSVMLFILWALQLSIVQVGQLFWGYGWETQLLETGFLAIFLAPLLDGRPFPKSRPSRIVIFLYCWLIARIMLGAGLIKLRGDVVWDWSELSALFYHFETQPIPNGFSWYFHHLPRSVLQAGVAFNHVVELFVPILLLLPRPIRNGAGFVMILFQIQLIVSGNLSFLNHLTIVPCLACIDDRFYRHLLPKRWWARLREPRKHRKLTRSGKIAFGIRLGILGLVSYLSIAPVTNLLSPNQRMNTSFERLRLVNTYGAFGTVGKVRYEIAVEGTNYAVPTSPKAQWKEYRFFGKPGDPSRRPPFFAPYQHRIDWEIWFASFGSIKNELWPVYFAIRLLQDEPTVLALLRENPFPETPPHTIRMIRYIYRFTTPQERAETGQWWVREFNQTFLEPISLDDPQVELVMRRYQWPKPAE